MTHTRFGIAASLIAVTLLAAPLAGAQTPRSAKSADPIGAPGSEMRGGADGTTAKLADGIKLRLAPGTRVRFERSTQLVLGRAGQASTPARSLNLLEGRIDVWVPVAKPLRVAVLVRAPRQVSAVVEGGHGIVLSSAAGVTVAAARGNMVAALGNEWRPLREGMARSISPADPSGKPHRLLGATHIAMSDPLLLSLQGASGETTAVWLPVPGAARYNVSVSRPDGTLVRSLRTSTHTARIDQLGPGLYEVRAQPVDRFGLEGPMSAPDSVRVVGVDLPAGSFMSGGAVLLRRGQRVHFKHVEGVQVSYDAASSYIPAPVSIGLARGHATRVRFRQAGATRDSASLTLAPLGLSARIEIGPQLARWPSDTVHVAVRVVDWNNHPIPSSIKIETQVSINGSPVNVHWTRRGDTLTSIVPARAGPGPWVVRVEVKDRFGQELGREFLEVASSTARVASAR